MPTFYASIIAEYLVQSVPVIGRLSLSAWLDPGAVAGSNLPGVGNRIISGRSAGLIFHLASGRSGRVLKHIVQWPMAAMHSQPDI